MKIAIVGTGYVGLVTGACFASKGNEVTCIDVIKEKIMQLQNGIIPIYEPGLKELIDQHKNNLKFSTDIQDIKSCDVVFICVGTPMGEDGSADLQYVLAVAKSIGQTITNPITIVDKSTVPVGTGDRVRNIIQEELDKRNIKIKFNVVSNPEFLKEGSAIDDFLNPDRVVVGSDSNSSLMRELYSFVSDDKFIEMDVKSAELTKYAANSMLATKISFINEIANICEYVGADINKVRYGIGMDKRIGFNFISPGCGYGGSCFPKDVKALIKTSDDLNYNAEILKSVENVNKRQKMILVNKIIKRFGENLTGKHFAIWGLAFKPNTDDMRESPAITVITELQKRGAVISAYDPKAFKEAKFYLKNVNLVSDKYLAASQADALIVITDWKEFFDIDLNKLQMKNKIIFDGRNIYTKEQLKGYEYYQIGVKQ